LLDTADQTCIYKYLAHHNDQIAEHIHEPDTTDTIGESNDDYEAKVIEDMLNPVIATTKTVAGSKKRLSKRQNVRFADGGEEGQASPNIPPTGDSSSVDSDSEDASWQPPDKFSDHEIEESLGHIAPEAVKMVLAMRKEKRGATVTSSSASRGHKKKPIIPAGMH
jgi:hypothetical protein